MEGKLSILNQIALRFFNLGTSTPFVRNANIIVQEAPQYPKLKSCRQSSFELRVNKFVKDCRCCIPFAELQALLPKMNYYLRPKDFHDACFKFTSAIGLDRKSRNKGLTFEQVASLLHKLKRDSWIVKRINVYWNDLFGELMKNAKLFWKSFCMECKVKLRKHWQM